MQQIVLSRARLRTRRAFIHNKIQADFNDTSKRISEKEGKKRKTIRLKPNFQASRIKGKQISEVFPFSTNTGKKRKKCKRGLTSWIVRRQLIFFFPEFDLD